LTANAAYTGGWKQVPSFPVFSSKRYGALFLLQAIPRKSFPWEKRVTSTPSIALSPLQGLRFTNQIGSNEMSSLYSVVTHVLVMQLVTKMPLVENV
jgi:hypothetical protein